MMFRAFARACAVHLAVLGCCHSPVHAQQAPLPRFEIECASITAPLAALVSATAARCGAAVQSFLTEASSEFTGDRVTLVLDNNEGLRALINSDDPAIALAWPGRIAHAGAQDGAMYWGIWEAGPVRRFEGEDERRSRSAAGAMPYVAGIAAGARAPASGSADYALLGKPLIVSRHLGHPDITSNSDNRGDIIEPGPIGKVDLKVDFERGRALATIWFSVRGVPVRTEIALQRRRSSGTAYFEVLCEDDRGAACPRAELRLYGSEYAGLLFSLPYNAVMQEAQRVPARLNNVEGYAAVALRRR